MANSAIACSKASTRLGTLLNSFEAYTGPRSSPVVRLLVGADIVVTESGGILEEASAPGNPTLVVRRTTGRTEAMEAGVAELVSPMPMRFSGRVSRLLTDAKAYRARARPTRIFGDRTRGRADRSLSLVGAAQLLFQTAERVTTLTGTARGPGTLGPARSTRNA